MPVPLYSIGHFSKNDYIKQTALLTAQSALDGEIADIVMKLVSDRRHATSIPKTSNFADSFLEGNNHFNGSFSSSHTAAAFSVATVVSGRYGARPNGFPSSHIDYRLQSASRESARLRIFFPTCFLERRLDTASPGSRYCVNRLKRPLLRGLGRERDRRQ